MKKGLERKQNRLVSDGGTVRIIVLVTILKRAFNLLDISKSRMSKSFIATGNKTREENHKNNAAHSFMVCRLGTLQEQPITSFPNSSNL